MVGCWMTSIPTIFHIFVFLGYSEFPSWLAWQPIRTLWYPKIIQQNISIMVGILVIQQPYPKSLSLIYHYLHTVSSEFGGICFPFPLSVFHAIGAGSSAGMSSCSNVCHLGISSTSEMVLALLCSVLGECVSLVCIVCLLAPSVFVRILDCVALSGGSGGSVCM